MKTILENIKTKTPLVHCITNTVTINDCANIILACGGSPIMADDIREVEEITAISQALAINIGTLNEDSVASMLKAGKKANALKHPVIFDPVGIGASQLRMDTGFKLLENIDCSVIRGNASEIKTIAHGNQKTKGVDADVQDGVTEKNLEEAFCLVKALSKKTKAVIVMTGAIDIVADEKSGFIIRNGHPMMSKITGTGCMLTAMIADFCGANPDNTLEATATAVALMGLCGQIAHKKVMEEKAGTGSFRVYLMDGISGMTPESMMGGLKIESKA